MTATLLKTLDSLGITYQLVDRRFSKLVSEVGKFRVRKLASAVTLLARVTCLGWRRPDTVIFFATTRPGSMIVDWAISEILRVSRLSTINYIHTQGFAELGRRGPLWRFAVGRLLRSASLTVCLGESLVEDVTGWIPRSRVRIVPNTIFEDTERPRFTTAAGAERPVILFLSNLFPGKGALDFVEMGRRLKSPPDAFRLVLVGATADEAYSARVRQTAAGGSGGPGVQIVGPADAEAKWRYLQEAYVLVFPSTSREEAQPLTIIEALSCGTPVLAYDTGGIRDVVADGVNGYLIPAGDLAGLATVVDRLLAHPDLRMRLADGALEDFNTRFSRQAFAQGWAGVLRDATEESRGASGAGMHRARH